MCCAAGVRGGSRPYPWPEFLWCGGPGTSTRTCKLLYNSDAVYSCFSGAKRCVRVRHCTCCFSCVCVSRACILACQGKCRHGTTWKQRLVRSLVRSLWTPLPSSLTGLPSAPPPQRSIRDGSAPADRIPSLTVSALLKIALKITRRRLLSSLERPTRASPR